MKLTSQVTEVRPARRSRRSCSERALMPSCSTTRGSVRSFQASWPAPTSTACTRAAPACSRASVKPPVEEPISRQTCPATSMAKWSQRGRQLESAAAHVRRARQHFERRIGVARLAGLGGFLAVDQHLAGHDERLRFLARFGQAALHQQPVEPASFMICGGRSGRPARAGAGAFAERRQHLVGARAFLLRPCGAILQAVDRREGDLVLRRVFAGGLAQRLGGFFHVQNVVDNLKRQADVLAVAGERGDIARRRRRRRWRPCAGWLAAGRRSWRGGWFRATARRAVCLRLRDRPPGRRSCRPRCRRRWRVRRSARALRSSGAASRRAPGKPA